MLLGDGEFDGSGASTRCRRRAGPTRAHGHEHGGDVGRRDLSPRCTRGVSQAGQADRGKGRPCTREAYGPIMVRCCWAKGYHEPLYLVSNMTTAEAACRWYEKRFRIETFFSDQKSRGFHIHKSHIADPQRLSRS